MANRSTFVRSCLCDSVGSGGLVWGKRPVKRDRELSYTESKQSEQSPPPQYLKISHLCNKGTTKKQNKTKKPNRAKQTKKQTQLDIVPQHQSGNLLL